MSNQDARSRLFNAMLKREKVEHEKKLATAERKWEFRYNNQDKRIKEMEETIRNLRARIRELKKENKSG